jgi:ribose transport system permease protein
MNKEKNAIIDINFLIRAFKGKTIGIFLAYIIIFSFLSFASPVFFTFSNIMTLMRQTVCTVLVAVGMTFVIGMGSIDLSVGSVVAGCGVICAALIKANVDLWVILLITMFMGIFFGFINGFVIAKIELPPFIVTLATMSIIRGLIYVYTRAIPIYGLRNSSFLFIGQGMIGRVPFPIILSAVFVVIVWYLIYRTKFGRYVLSVGSNEEVSSLVGINVVWIKIKVFTLMGFCCSLSGLVLTSRLGAAMHDAGTGYEMDAIAATVIGGTSLSGGKARLLGTVIGALIMSTVQNALTLLNIDVFWHQVVKGTIILIAVIIDKAGSQKM